MTEELKAVAQRLADDWFDRLWLTKRLEIEVHAVRRRRGLDVEDGLRLWAPFGLGSEQTEWWVPVRRRHGVRGEWTTLRSVHEAQREVEAVLAAALDP